MKTCPDCHKHWDENYRGELYCPKCGQTKADAIKRQKRDSKEKPLKQETIVNEIKSHPVYGWMWRLTEKIANDLGFDIKVVFCNARGSRCVYGSCNPGEKRFTIRYGYECIDNSYTKGFREYKTWRWVWNYESYQTKKGVWQLVLHEIAHAVQTNKVGRGYGVMHDMTWAQAVKDLQKRYPFESLA